MLTNILRSTFVISLGVSLILVGSSSNDILEYSKKYYSKKQMCLQHAQWISGLNMEMSDVKPCSAGTEVDE